MTKRRALVGLNPLVWLGVGTAAAWRAAQRRPARATAVAATVAVVASLTVMQVTATDPRPQQAPAAAPPVSVDAGELSIADRRVLPDRPQPPLPTGTAVGRDLRVSAVPADEGFWVGTGPAQQVWVQLVAVGESRSAVQAGDRVSFTGVARQVDAGLPARIGLTEAEGAAELLETGVYVEVREADLRITPG